MTEEQKRKILTILETNEFGVVATNSENGAPESAVVSVSETPNLELIIGSFDESRKNRNLRRDSRISLVVGWDDSKTIQIEGTAEFVSGEERRSLEEIHCKKNEASLEFKDDPRQEYIKITPNWIRYSDYSVDPQEVWEISV